jgi:hypothetical protein
MSTVDSAPFASPLELTDPSPLLFRMRDEPNIPVSITVPGSSKFDLTLFNIIATGSVKADVPGRLLLTLYGRAKPDGGTADPATWLPLASAPPEPIGGLTDLKETMWMIKGADLMIYTGSGKMQGWFASNVANNPQAPIDLMQHPGDITDEDPLYIFSVGASFLPDDAPARAVKAPVLCTVTLVNFTMDA